MATLTERVAAGEYGGRVEANGRRSSCESLADSVNGLAARLAREGHSRANFIGKVSHELRTPLTVIKGYVYALRRVEDDPARAAKLDIINGECERLAYLVEDLLELSRAQAGELRVSAELFSLRDCVEEMTQRLAAARPSSATSSYRPAVAGRNGALVMGDENRVRQILRTWSPTASSTPRRARRSASRATAPATSCEVSVSDSGRGIASAAVPHIFDEFYQAPGGAEPGAAWAWRSSASWPPRTAVS